METLQAVKERPILFNGEMVRAILEGRKTQTRRVMKRRPRKDEYFDSPPQFGTIMDPHPNRSKFGVFKKIRVREDLTLSELIPCPYGAPGDQLWVRETWDVCIIDGEHLPSMCYRADSTAIPTSKKKAWDLLRSDDSRSHKWRPSIHMPRWASRIQLEITDVRVERVQDISEADAIAEGVSVPSSEDALKPVTDAQTWFSVLWDNINAERGFGWNVNPWVWVVEFKRVNP